MTVMTLVIVLLESVDLLFQTMLMFKNFLSKIIPTCFVDHNDIHNGGLQV